VFTRDEARRIAANVGWPGNSISRGDARCPHNTDTGTQDKTVAVAVSRRRDLSIIRLARDDDFLPAFSAIPK